MGEAALDLEEVPVYSRVVPMIEVAQQDEETSDAHRLCLAARVHLLRVGEDRPGEDTQDEGKRLVKGDHNKVIQPKRLVKKPTLKRIQE